MGAVTVVDALAGPVTAEVDDVVLRRNDGVPAYNLAVVVDDAAQGVTQVVRGDDLLASSPRQAHLRSLLGLPEVALLHVPLVLGPDGDRLAKRHGAVTLADLTSAGWSADRLVSVLAQSLGWCEAGEPVTAASLVDRVAHDPGLVLRVPREPWLWPGVDAWHDA